MKSLLVHICCGPCAIVPVKEKLGEDFDITGFYYNPNIHPEEEYVKRRESVEKLASLIGVKMLYAERYDPDEYFERVGATPGETPPSEARCRACYAVRLDETARKAAEEGFDCFTSSLLYSKYQDHDGIRAAGEAAAKNFGVPFFYQDFRGGWGRGIKLSKKMGLYRQQWCGCVYSLEERRAAMAASAAREEAS